MIGKPSGDDSGGFLFWPVAQLVARLALNQEVQGSNPCRPAKFYASGGNGIPAAC